MITWARFAGEIWDTIFAGSAVKGSLDSPQSALVDDRLTQWIETSLPIITMPPIDSPPLPRHHRQQTLIHTRFSHLRLLLQRRSMLNLSFDSSTGRLCGDLAIDIVQRLREHASETQAPTSFQLYMSLSIGGAILILATLLVRDLTHIGLQDNTSAYAESFRVAVSLLNDLAHLPIARRVADDLTDVAQVVTTVLNQPGIAYPEIKDILKKIPYHKWDFTPQADQGESPGSTGENEASMAGTVSGKLTHFDPWDTDLERKGAGYGVPWL
jgi:hypothetical protein